MKLYELITILKPDLTEDEIKSFLDAISYFIQQNQGVFIDSQKPIKKPLFFENNKINQGFLMSIKFQLLPEKIETLKTFLKTKKELLRFMVLSTKEIKNKEQRKRSVDFINKKTQKEKVNLSEIEKKLEEILK
jgi:ribosomal protein S6